MSVSFSESIKNMATELGFQKVGITKAEVIPDHQSLLEKWINSGGHETMDWIVKR